MKKILNTIAVAGAVAVAMLTLRVNAAVTSFTASSTQLIESSPTLTLIYTSNFLSDGAVGILASTGICTSVGGAYTNGGVFFTAGPPSGICTGILSNSAPDIDPMITTSPQAVVATVALDDFATTYFDPAVGHGGQAWIIRGQLNANITTFKVIVHPIRIYSSQLLTIVATPTRTASFNNSTGYSGSVRTGDTIATRAANSFNTTYSLVNPAGLNGVTIDNTSGVITIPSGQFVSGVRTIAYQVCQAVTNTTNCATANFVATIAGTISASNDINTTTTGGGIFNVLVNDTLNSQPATPSSINIAIVSNGGVMGASFNAAGQLVVPPGQTAGIYTLTYRICESPGITNCATAAISLTINAIPVLIANDTTTLSALGGAISILANDQIGGVAATPANADITLLSNGGITAVTINSAGQLVIPAGLPAGGYVLTYRLCQKATMNCQTGTVNLTVLAALTAAADSANLTTAGGTINILANDTVGAVAATTINADITLTSNGGIAAASINPTGQLVIPAGLTINTYNLTYQLCQKSTTNCVTGIVTLSVAPLITVTNIAVTFPGAGGQVSLLTNNIVGGQPATPTNSDITITITGNGGINAATVNPQGQLVIPAGLVAGNYILQYKLCQKSTLNCGIGTVTITISVRAGTLIIANDRVALPPSGGLVDLLANDTIEGRRATVNDLTVSLVNNGAIVGLSINTSAQMIVPSGLGGGAYQAKYRACQQQLPSNCGEATVYIIITQSVSGTLTNRPPSVPGSGASPTSVTIAGPTGSPITFNTAAGTTNTAGAVNDPLTFSSVKLVFGDNESGKVQAFYRHDDRFDMFGAQLYYSGSGVLRGRWEVVYPGDPLPTELDLFPEAGLPISLRQQQQRYFQIDRAQQFLSPIGRYFLAGPDPSRLPRNVPGQYLILLRIEATAGTGGAEGGRAAFAFPVLRYAVQEAVAVDGGAGNDNSHANSSQKLAGSGANAAQFSDLGIIPRGALVLESSSLRPNQPGQGFVGLGPKPISLMLPQDATNIAKDKPLSFTWVDMKDVIIYRFEMETASGKSLLVAQIKPGISSYTAPPIMRDDMPPATLVRWRIVGLNGEGKAIGVADWRSVRFE